MLCGTQSVDRRIEIGAGKDDAGAPEFHRGALHVQPRLCSEWKRNAEKSTLACPLMA